MKHWTFTLPSDSLVVSNFFDACQLVIFNIDSHYLVLAVRKSDQWWIQKSWNSPRFLDSIHDADLSYSPCGKIQAFLQFMIRGSWGSRGSQGSQNPHFEGIGSPGSPGSPGSHGSPYLLHDLQTDVDRSKVKEQLTKGKVIFANNILLLINFQLSLSLIKSCLNLFQLSSQHSCWYWLWNDCHWELP